MTREDFNGSRVVNILTHLFTGGTIYLAGEITQQKAIEFSMAMSVLYEEQKKVKIVVNSPGGEVNAGLMIYDIIQAYPFGIDMYCAGIAASMGAVILAGGKEGRRFILPHSRDTGTAPIPFSTTATLSFIWAATTLRLPVW